VTYQFYVCGPRTQAPKGVKVVNTTSRGGWSKELSPFYLGPVLTPAGVAKNVENAWQYSKVYSCHVDDSGSVKEEWHKWRQEGFDNPKAIRYPMGKGAVPLYSLWNNEKLAYIEARKKIYAPIYAKLVRETYAMELLREMVKESDVWLWDFDGYNHKAKGISYTDVINDPKLKMGHAFVVAMILEEDEVWNK